MEQAKSQGSTIKAIVLWALVIAWCAFIFFASAHTATDLSAGDDLLSCIRMVLADWQASTFGPDVDIISTAAHFAEYLVLGVLLFAALAHQWGVGKAALIAAIALASLYGATDEFHQLFVEGRYCDVWDWVTDTVGAALGAGVSCAVRSFRREGSAPHLT